MITSKKLENFINMPVKLIDCDDRILYGWFIKGTMKYYYVLLPFNDIWNTYSFRASHIKSIKFLTNGYEIR